MTQNQIQIYPNPHTSQEKKYNLLQKDLEIKIKSLSKLGNKLLSRFIDLNSSFACVIIERKTLAANIKCSEKQVGRLTKLLHAIGLVEKIDRGFKKACQYKVNINLLNNRGDYVKFLPSLKNKGSKFPQVSERFCIDFPAKNWGSSIDQKYAVSHTKLRRNSNKNVPQVNSSSPFIYKQEVSVSFHGKCYTRENSGEVAEITSRNETGNDFFKKNIEEKKQEAKGNEIERISAWFDSFIGKEMEKKLKEEEMKKDENILITPAIFKATETLNLTKCGQATLRIYCDEAIEHGLSRLMRAINVNDEFDYVWQEAKKYTHDNRLEENFSRCRKLKDAYGIESTDRVFVQKPQRTFKKESNSSNKQTATHNSFNGVPASIRELGLKMLAEDRERDNLDKAVAKKIQNDPRIEIKNFLDLVFNTEQGQNALRVMRESFKVSPGFFDAVKRITEPERKILFTQCPFLENAEIGVWPAIIEKRKNRTEKLADSHWRARRYLTDEEYKRCLIITPFNPVSIKPVYPKSCNQEIKRPEASDSNFTFKSVSSIIRTIMPEGQDPITFGKIATKIMDGVPLEEIEEIKKSNPNKVRDDWDSNNQGSLPF